jgi:hypothetical protein
MKYGHSPHVRSRRECLPFNSYRRNAGWHLRNTLEVFLSCVDSERIRPSEVFECELR